MLIFCALSLDLTNLVLTDNADTFKLAGGESYFLAKLLTLVEEGLCEMLLVIVMVIESLVPNMMIKCLYNITITQQIQGKQSRSKNTTKGSIQRR